MRVRFGVRDGVLRICVHDQGEGFQPEEVADPRDPLNVARTSGRGIFLMRSFMDEVSFASDDGEGTKVCMAKKA